ncbi:UxaA family hydrolase [Sedimentitalea sp. JM2-8]|uniref:UxaA family hydrolase n=1 Tax=Sedimentitalea xiamensis TaxID=3050037 RepID=A0ABT7FFJ5_9RHOB|nr:UxaA family hydrolase [Sedimentitalea xiamensis]MDK3073906.1 UxaA family hydrolase [Sedimentitalea xiamensis]
MSFEHFTGYGRSDGRVGIRNLPLVIAVMDNCNPLTRRIAGAVQGAVPIVAAYGRGQKGDDQRVHDMTLVNYGSHPNCQAALVVGLEHVTAERIAAKIAETGRPVDWIDVQGQGGTLNAFAEGVRRLTALIDANPVRLVKSPISDLVVGLECGGSDALSGISGNAAMGVVADRLSDAGATVILSEIEEIIGAEHVLVDRASSDEVRAKLLAAVERCERHAVHLGLNMAPLGEDNILGGLSTTEEKSLGAVRKSGTSPLNEVIGYGEKPRERGVVFMDAPAPGTENVTALGAAGAHMILFNTGRGNPIGNPVSPTLKITGSPNTAMRFADNIDIDVSAIVSGEMNFDLAADLIMEMMDCTARGRLTASERLGDTELSISRIDNGFLRILRETCPSIANAG